MIKQAMTLSDDLTLFSSPWSPPGWMKTNGRMDKGRYLRKDCRQVWADYIVKFLLEYEKKEYRSGELRFRMKHTRKWDGSPAIIRHRRNANLHRTI